ncbi:MAG TPA: hypothetical protein PKC67_02830 [Kiritimatiellia bacterium]|mgnify:CR=1 FL=1|nr:hypothetical protein [Kiritimatiellia bacterium]
MSTIDDALFKLAGPYELGGSPSGRLRVGVDYLGRQAVALVKPGAVALVMTGDVVSPSKSIRESYLKSRTL